MNVAPDAHANCFPCQQRRERCIYRYLGPCKFDEPEEFAAASEGDGQNGATKQKETNERLLDQAALVLAEDQMLASTVLKEEAQHQHHHSSDWSKVL